MNKLFPDLATVVSVPARVCFFGDNVDWISGPALLCAIDNLRTFVKITNNHKEEIILQSYNVPTKLQIISLVGDKKSGKKEWFSYAEKVIKILKEKYELKLRGINIQVNSTLPIAAGLSSSAALCVAVCGALNEHFNLRLNYRKIAHIAYLAERYELGVPCGQMDQYSVVFGNLLYVNCATEPPKEIEKFVIREKFIVIIGDTQIARNTGMVIDTLKERLKNNDPLILEYTRKAENIIKDARNYLKREKWDLNQIGIWLNRCQKILKENLLTSNEKLDLFTSAAVKSGALGAKLTGAGRGGCMFAICSQNNYKNTVKLLESLGAKVFIGYIPSEGLRKETLGSFNDSLKFSYSFT